MNRLTVSMIFVTCSCLSAQEFRRFTGDIGAGFTQPVGNTGRNLDVGWNVQGGFGLNVTPYLGAKIDLAYNHFDLSSFALNSVGAPDGNVQIFSATLNPVVHLNPTGHFDVYLTGGGGVYHWFQEFTQPTVATFTAFNPFFGFYPIAVGVNQVLGSYSVNKPGIDAGAGIALERDFTGRSSQKRVTIASFSATAMRTTFLYPSASVGSSSIECC